MRSGKAAFVLALAAVLVCAASSRALALRACAASPDGKLIVVGGENRALYVLDAASGEIVKRIWLGPRIDSIDFTPDGSQCVVCTDEKAAYVLSTKDWSVTRRFETVISLAIAAASPVAVVGTGKFGSYVIALYSLPDWTVTKQIPMPPATSADGVAVTADGKTAYARSGRVQDNDEKKIDPGPQPKDYGEQSLWRQRNDGFVNDLYIIDVAGGTVTKTIKCFDTATNYRLFPVPGGVVTVAYNQYAGTANAETGDYKVVMTKQFAYGSGQGPDGNLYIGSLASFVVWAPEGRMVTKQEIGRLPGFPEYFRCFAPLGKDKVLGVTDAYRAILIDAKTYKVLKEINCY